MTRPTTKPRGNEITHRQVDAYARRGRMLQSEAVRTGFGNLFGVTVECLSKPFALLYERMKQTPASIIR